MKIFELENKNLFKQKYFGLARLHTKLNEDGEEGAPGPLDGPQSAELKNYMLDMLMTWKRSTGSNVINLNKFINDLNLPGVDLDPVKDKSMIMDLLANLGDQVEEVDARNNKIILKGNKLSHTASPDKKEQEADKIGDKAMKSASKNVKDNNKGGGII